MSKELTKRQQVVVEAIQSWIRAHGYPPTIRELGRQLGIKSLRGVTTHLDAIAKKGVLKREPRARGITLSSFLMPIERAIRIPVLGSIRAGQPGLAQEQAEDHVVVDAGWVGASDSTGGSAHFALKVRGESMIEAGILDGDFVIVRRQPSAEHGDIVVALLGEEATVKRFLKEDGRIRLQPAHPTMEPIVVSPPADLALLGKVVGVFRRL